MIESQYHHISFAGDNKGAISVRSSHSTYNETQRHQTRSKKRTGWINVEVSRLRRAIAMLSVVITFISCKRIVSITISENKKTYE